VARKRKSSKSLGWHVVSTWDEREFEVISELTKAGFEAETPVYRLEPNRMGVRRTLPLFEGYVFARESVHYWRIRAIPGINNVLMSCERPAVLADDVLQFFLNVSVDEKGYYVDPVMRVHRIGEVCIPRSGRFAGLQGRLTELDATGRTEMLFSLLGREVRTREYRVAELA
jgi:transcription antitermination factor NusG